MFTWKRLVLAGGGLIVAALLFASLLLPGILIDKARQWVAAETGRTLTVEAISINPLTLSVEIRAASLSERDRDAPFASWQLLRVALSPQALFRRAPILRELRLDRPTLHLERLTADTFNFSDLLPARQATNPAEATAKDGEPVRFSVSNFSINDGHIDLVDSSLAEPMQHTIRDLQLVLPVIGNLPAMIENPAQPLFRAVVNDAPIHLDGQLKPFSAVQEMQFDLNLQGIDLPFYLGYLPVELPVEIRNGRLGVDLAILYRVSTEAGGELELSGRLDLTTLDIYDRFQERLFFLPLLQVEIAPSQPLQRQLHLAALRAYNLEVNLKRDNQGEWNHARLAPARAEQAAATAEQSAAAPFKLLVDSIDLRDGVVFFADHLPTGGFQSVARAINLDVRQFTLEAGQAIPFRLDLATERAETIAVHGHFQLAPFRLDLAAKLDNLLLGAYQPYYQDVYRQPFGGLLSLESQLLVSPEQPLLVSDGKLALRGLQGAFNDQEGVAIDRLDVDGLAFDLARKRLDIDAVSSAGARINFSRDRQGAWSFLSRNFPVLAGLAEVSAPPAQTRPPANGPTFSYRIGAVTLSNWGVAIRDELPATPARLTIDDLSLSISNLAAPEKLSSPFTLAATLQGRGKLALQGSTSLSDQETTLSAHLRTLPLATLAPYVAEQADLVLTDGFLDARLQGKANRHGEALQINFGGDVGFSKMHLLDSRHREDLLKWDSLQFAGIDMQLQPLAIKVASITLSDYFTKVLIDEEARLNLVEAFRKDAPAADETGAPTATTEPPPSAVRADIRIGTVVLQGGRVDFTDRHLPRPFHADMRALGGRIEGLSAAAGSLATVDLRGSLRNQSPLTVSGTLNPLAEQLFLDLKLNFNDIELSPLSPYSGSYVGYLIEKGKLNLTLEYFVEDGQLKASNQVFLDQFNFGEAVASDRSIGLPVKLATALLKDRRGEIHLDIPVVGSLDDPQFSITGVVWRIIRNLLVKAATSPLALLGALVGGGDEDFSSIPFELGSARLGTAEQDKLRKMAAALLDRPGLEIEVSGFIDAEHDAEGYRRERLALQIRRLKYLDLVKAGELAEGISEEEVTVPTEEYADYLWEVYRDADFPKPRNFIGMTKKLPAAEMEKLLYASTTVSADDLADLAQARALAVQNFLMAEGQIARERIFLKKPDITAPPDAEHDPRARVVLGASVR